MEQKTKLEKGNNLPTVNEFIEEIKEYNPNADFKLIKKAFQYSKKAHKNQKRDSGEPYIIHPIEVSRILMRLNVDSATICAAILHDVIEDTKITYSQLSNEFTKEIANIVDGLTNLEKFKFESKEEYTNENIRKVLLASSKDIRVILIKLADRLHNMQTLKHIPHKNQKRIAKISLDIFAPIAEKLGLWLIKGELEDLALRFLEPKEYQALKKKIGTKRQEREEKTEEIVEFIHEELKNNHVSARVFGRAKYFYSIYKKMISKHKEFNQIFDLIGIRIITSTQKECYDALNLIHNLWPHKKITFKDYIKYPKDNGYKSIHTTVYGPYNKLLEIQIRSLNMHYEAEEGVAAHWRYAGTERDKEFDRRINWFKQAIEWRRFSKNAKEFIESLRMDFYENEIIVLTPKGDPIPLKEGSTPLDFAYEVHTSIGNHCAAAIVNGKAVPLNYKLKSGQIVHIKTARNAKPSRTWLNIVQTKRAKSKIRHIIGLTKSPKVIKSTSEKSMLSNKIQLKDPSIKANVKLALCCRPNLNDPIVGFNARNSDIIVHNLECSNISIFDKKNRINVFWKIKETEKSFFRIKVQDRVGLLSEILNIFTEYKLKIESVTTKIHKKNVFIGIKTKKIESDVLKELSIRLKSIPNVLDIFLS